MEILDSIEYNNNEELFPVVRFFLDLLDHKVFRTIISIGQTITTSLWIWQAYCVLKHFSTKYFLQYSPFLCVSGFVTITLYLYIYGYKAFSHQIREFKTSFCWSINMASRVTRQRIKRESSRTKYMNITQIILTEITCSAVAYKMVTDSTNFFAPSAEIANYYPGLNVVFYWAFAPLICLAIFPIFFSIWHSYYLLIYIKFQYYMLIDVLKSRSWFPTKSSGQKDDTPSKLLKIFLKRHVEIIDFLNRISLQATILNTSFFISGQLIILYTVFAVFSHHIGWFTACISLGTYIFGLIQFAIDCQLFEDTIGELDQAFYDLDWYNWKVNQIKCYRIAHYYISQKQSKFPVISVIEPNCVQLKKVIQLWCTVFNFYYSTNRS